MSGGLLAAALFAAGCGGGTPKPSATATPVAAAVTATPAEPSHDSFIRSLDATCRGSVANLQAAANAAGDDTGRLAIVTTRYAATIRRVIAKQDRLEAPVEDKRAFVRYLAAQRQAAGVFERLTTALRDDDLDQARYLLSLLDGVREDRTRAALELGARRCGA